MNRSVARLEMIRLRRAHFGGPANYGCWCDHCLKSIATDMHECIQRSRVQSMPESVQELIFQPELCGMLCQTCHIAATSLEVVASIRHVNTELYGPLLISRALHRLPRKIWKDSRYGNKEILYTYGGLAWPEN